MTGTDAHRFDGVEHDQDDGHDGAPQQLPRDEDAERAVLGAVMLSPRAFGEVRPMLDGSDFYRLAHEQIWNAACSLADRGAPVDALTIAAELGSDLGRIGGGIYLHDCLSTAPMTASAAYYAQILRDKAFARRVVTTGTRLAAIGRSEEIDGPLRSVVRAEYAALLEAETRGWPDPAPLGKAVTDPPEFPADALPGWLAMQVAAVADETQTPMDLAGTLALAMLATAAGGKAKVQVRPGSWSEPVNLYTVAALPPGTRKSPVFTPMAAPLLEVETLLQEHAKPRIVEAAITRRIAEERAAKAATAAAKANMSERYGAEAEAREAAHELEAATVPALPRLMVDDVTAEMAASMLADQGGRLAVLSAESEIFDIIAGRYSGTPSMNVFLKGHAGDMLRVDRKGRPAEAVDDPAITMGVCTQPIVLRSLADIPGAAGRGLLARFLYVVPNVNIGGRDSDPPASDPAIGAKYDSTLRALALTLYDLAEPVRLTLDEEAQQLRRDVSASFETRMREDGDLAGIREWACKAVGAGIRIAGLLHLAEHLKDGYAKPISGATMRNALRILEYYTTHALVAFDAMTTDDALVRARAVLEWIERNGADRFTARQAFSAFARTRFPRIADMDTALALLERHGHIRRLPETATAGRGRPSAPAYEAHPGIGI